jgi:hypothetical protein
MSIIAMQAANQPSCTPIPTATSCSAAAPRVRAGLVYALNNLGNQWSGTSSRPRQNQEFKPTVWDGHEAAHPDQRTTDAEGNSEFPAPPRGYCVYAPVPD